MKEESAASGPPSSRGSDPWDVLIIGGGPAGACAASLLARGGRRVLVLEKEKFPRYHVGESLIPGCLRVFDAIGVRDQVESAGFVVKRGVTFSWGLDGEWGISFAEQGASPDYAFQVDRARFDKILLDHARSCGAEVREQVTVGEVEFVDDAARVTTSAGVEQAAYVIDASGQGSVLGRRLGERKFDETLRNVAIWRYYRGCPRQVGAKAGNISILRHGDGWWWFIPLEPTPAGMTSVGVVMSRDSYRALGAKVQGAFDEARAAAPELGAWLDGAQPASELRAAADWSYRSGRVTGDRWLLAGDAAGFVDPLLSTGCYLALSGGYLAGVCLTSVLDDPELKTPAFAYYENSYGKVVDEVHQMVRVFYSSSVKEEAFDGAKSILKIDGDPRELFIRLAAGNVEYSASESKYLGGENAMPSEVFGSHSEAPVHYGVPFDTGEARVLALIDPQHLPASAQEPMVLVEQYARLSIQPASAFDQPAARDDVEGEGVTTRNALTLAEIKSDVDAASLLGERIPRERGATALVVFDDGSNGDPVVVGFTSAAITESYWSVVGEVALSYLTDPDAPQPFDRPEGRRLLEEVLAFARNRRAQDLASPLALQETILSHAAEAGWRVIARASRP